MKKLIGEYRELLNAEAAASVRFWKLEERLRNDQRSIGVIIHDMRRINLPLYLTHLLVEGVINESDLEGFTGRLKEAVLHRSQYL